MPRYEVVLFDADHTLFDFDRAEREALRQTLEEAGLPADGETEARYLSINRALWNRLDRGEVRREWLVVEPVILIFVMVFSFLILVVLATNLVGYSSSFSNAEDAYAKGDYEQAFQDVAGLEVKEKDQDTYRKYRILAYTAGQYRAYQNLVNQKIYDMALDSLISTIGRCEEYSSDAKELGCEGEISDIQAKAEEALEAFKIDTKKALEVYDMKDRTAYSKEIYQILDDAGLSEE